MKNLYKVFAVSALSLAVSTAHADGTGSSDCSSMTDVNSFAFWENPVLLTTCVLGNEPPASGPDNQSPGVDSRDVGRHDSQAYEADVQGEDQGPELHIDLPDYEDGGRVMYAVWGDHYEGEPDSVGSITVSLVNDDSEDGEGDQVSFTHYSESGEVLSSKTYANGEGVDVDDPGYYEYSESGAVVESNNEGPYEFNEYHGYHSAEAGTYQGNEDDGSGEYAGEDSYVSGNSGTFSYGDENELLVKYWFGYFEQETYSGSWSCVEGNCTDNEDYTELSGMAFGGESTPLSDINSLIASDVSAIYSGGSFQRGHQHITIVNFGDKTAEGSFSGGRGTDFDYQGRVEGVHIISTSVSSSEADITGYVQATFMGDQAVMMGGAYKIESEAGVETDIFYGFREDLNAGPN